MAVDLDPPWTELQLFRAILGILCMPVNDSAPAASFLVHTNEHLPRWPRTGSSAAMADAKSARTLAGMR